MEKLRLVAWNEAEASERAAFLSRLGYAVDASPARPPFRSLVEEGLKAIVIDLSRLPSQGRDVGVSLRRGRATRDVPLVFVGGQPDKVARVRETLPDAVFCEWSRISKALKRAKPLRDPFVPSSALAGYAATPLPKKLGVREGSVVVVLGAPRGFASLLGDGAIIRRGDRGRRDLTIVFVRRPEDIERTWEKLASHEYADDVWMVWAKKASPAYAGVTQSLVRGPGMAHGFVDFKVAAIDETWSGLKFKRRQPKP